MNLFEIPKPYPHDCIIAVDEQGTAFLLKSEPSLHENELFDGNDLHDNLTHDKDKIPKEFGIYQCKIMVESYKYLTDCGYEYNVNIWIEDVVKIELPNLNNN